MGAAGAMGAWAPTEIWQRVHVNRPEKHAILLKTKKCSKITILTKGKLFYKGITILDIG